MNFENQYLTYEEYQKLEGKLQQMPFNLLEYKAEKKIDEITFNRFRNLTEYPQELKLCVYELIDIFNNENNSSIVSESVGNYSISMKSTADIEKTKENIIKQYLLNTKVDDIPVLYRGADIDED